MEVRPDTTPFQTLGDVLRFNASAYPREEAATDGTARLSWQELYQRAESVCAQLRNLEIRSGDRVAVVLPNQIETLVLYWACALSGAIFVGANPRLGHDELRRILDHSGAAVVFLSESVDGGIASGVARRVVVRDDTGFGQPFASIANLHEHALPEVCGDDVFAIVYTSGTTGPAKGVELSHRNLLWTAHETARALAIDKNDAFLVTVQITHIFGLSAAILVAALRGARCVLMREHSAGPALDLCEWEGVSVHHGSPTMFALELAAQRRAPRDLSKLRTGIIAAAPVDPELVDAVRAELHCNVQIAWGLSETSPTVTITHDDDPVDERRTSVGRALPGVELRLDDVGGEFAEILVRSPGVFRGYYDDPHSTQAAMADGYFRTGDLGRIDARGFLHLAGRLKDIIIRGGLHVYPEELEYLIRALPWVEAVAIVGIPDRVLGERVCACVVVATDASAPSNLLAAIRSAVEKHLADYKVPDAVVRVSELPRTAGGKILKRVLRENAIANVSAQ